MKKILLATSALVAFGAVGAAAPAVAQDKLQLTLGGFMKQEFGYAKNDNFPNVTTTPAGVQVIGGVPTAVGPSTTRSATQRKGFDQQTDAEVYFRGTLKLDNGISVMVHVELEAEDSTDMIDEQYLRVFGSFGDLRLGSLNNAAYQMSYHAPDYGVGYNEAFIYNYITVPGGGLSAANANPATFLETTRLSADNDSNKIAYFTPRMFGFQFGASYTPDFADNEDSFPTYLGKYRNGLSAALNYDNKFGAFYLAGNVGFLSASKPKDGTAGLEDLRGYNAGLNVGFGGFLVGGAYQRYTSGNITNANGNVAGGGFGITPGASAEGTVWNIGGAYNFGPGGVSLTYQKGKVEGVRTNPGDNELEILILSARYIVGPGVSVYGSVARGEYHDDVKTGAGAADGDNTGYAAIGGIRVDF